MAYEANDLDQAGHDVRAALELGQRSAITVVVLYATEALAKVQYALGEQETALVTIQQAQRLAHQMGERVWAAADAALEADLRLRQGDVLFAERWAQHTAFPRGKVPDPADRHEFPTYARLLLAQGRPERVRALLAQSEVLAKAGGRCRQLITTHILQALAGHMVGDNAAAQTCLEQALRLAAPEGYVRAFLDEGLLLARLLPQVRHVAPTFVDALLSAYGVEQTCAPSCVPDLIEALSERELEVLRLLAGENSAPQIARALTIAVSTIRSHIKHIYAKLGAHSRYEAVERARKLGLL
jgi:LuxR family maltose regulon positive regulatory protein